MDGQALDIKLSMTPENIRPLVENTKEVHMHLNDFVKDMHALLDTYAPCSLDYSFTYLRTSRAILFQSYSARIQCFFSAPFWTQRYIHTSFRITILPPFFFLFPHRYEISIWHSILPPTLCIVSVSSLAFFCSPIKLYIDY